ncbi:3'-5' exonuclease, partial [Pseudomonas viridiflava]|uniref:3'-5' exonuclease n=1 Tax=Pseudomonas viridiflava TaxID=33069 RepID=UPI0024028724
TILRLNYRNTVEVLSVARAFALELLVARDAVEDGVPVVAPESAGRRGPYPELIRCESDWHELDCMFGRLRDEQARGRGFDDMAVIYRSNAQAERIEKALANADIPFASGL